jgi:hypothetical protein
MAALHHSSKQMPHCLDLFELRFKFSEFSLGELFPSPGGRSAIAEAEEQLPDFIQRKARLSRLLYDGEPMEHRIVIPPLPTDPLSRQK